ncbi:MAG: hypothetical protein IJ772_05360 [Bacilli bacterium]|nr:hypothetical protein [Bacilli bacterium]
MNMIQKGSMRFLCDVALVKRVVNGYAQLVTSGHYFKVEGRYKAIRDGVIVKRGYILNEIIHRKMPLPKK